VKKNIQIESPLKEQRKIMITAQRIADEYERELIYYAKYKSGLVSDYLKLVLCLLCVPLLTLLVFIASLFIVVGMWFMWFKDFIKALTSKNNFI
jgi:hypothetical protein